MAWIKLIEPEEANEHVKQVYRDIERFRGAGK